MRGIQPGERDIIETIVWLAARRTAAGPRDTGVCDIHVTACVWYAKSMPRDVHSIAPAAGVDVTGPRLPESSTSASNHDPVLKQISVFAQVCGAASRCASRAVCARRSTAVVAVVGATKALLKRY